jgi:pteridine reductase
MSSNPFRLSVAPLAGQTALVTGAVRRIGRAVALALADDGLNVVVHHRRSPGDADKVCEEIADRGVRAFSVDADLDDLDALPTLVDRAAALAGSLHVLVNNASRFGPDSVESVTFDAVVENMRTNAWAPLALSRAFARQALRGKIVNLLDSNIAGGDRSHVSYLLSKQVLAAVTRMTALELAPNVTVNAVAPGLILPPAGEDEAYLERLSRAVPLGRHGTPEDVADAVVFLVRSEFVTGQTIWVDGGAHLGGKETT